MKSFMDEDFLLESEYAARLYHNYAEKMPILDYHCHIDPEEIAKNRKFENITQLWLGGKNPDGTYFGDHYKWRLMRSEGIEEKYVTGGSGVTDRERFQKWAETLERAIGNPLYHWSHLELRRFFDYDGVLNRETAESVWKLCNERLRDDSMRVRGLIERSNVKLICTTDDPADDLHWHKVLRNDKDFQVQVLPAWRPDKINNIEKSEWDSYVSRLGETAGIRILSFSDIKKVLEKRMDFFHKMGCRISDHALNYMMYRPSDEKEIEKITAARLAGETLSEEDVLRYKTAMMMFFANKYRKYGWAMQIHFGCKRDNNTEAFEKMGPDTGYDCISGNSRSDEMTGLLNQMNRNDNLPKTILYSLDPNDNARIVSVIGCFQGAGIRGKLQNGSAWWFNDHKKGMIDQLTTLANEGALGTFVGMLTDSRSFLSYPRHEYFRRILCNLIGGWVEKGEYPADEKTLGSIVEDISYNNAVRYFGFDLDEVRTGKSQ